MKLLQALTIVALSSTPALAQTAPVPRYGEVDKAKSPAETEREQAAEAAYRRSLGNVPNASGSSDPWGSVRSESAPKPGAKVAPVKKPQ